MINVRVVCRPAVEVPSELLATFIFEESRPPKKSIGDIDWFMNGFISRTIWRDELNLRFGGVNLLATQCRIEAPKLLLMGMGSSRDFSVRLVEECFSRAAFIIKDLKINNAAIISPDISDESDSGLMENVFESSVKGMIRGCTIGKVDRDMWITAVVDRYKSAEELKRRLEKALRPLEGVNFLPT